MLHSKMKSHVLVVFSTISLWGDHGQEALENAHVCLINATATGTEILKNLVLPGKQIVFMLGAANGDKNSCLIG